MAHSSARESESGLDLGRGDDLPVGVHLAWRLRALILSGRLAAGDRLPGVRDLAAGAGVNVNTARAIYGRLEDEGLVTSRHGQGTFVVPDVASSPALEQVAAEAAESARSLGIDPRDLARTIYAGSPSVPPGVGPGDPERTLPGTGVQDGRAARRTLRVQVARLEAELAAYPDFIEAGSEPVPLHGPEPRIADIGELERVRDELVDRLARARDAAVGHDAAQDRLQRMATEPEAHKWATVSSQEIGEPGCSVYQVRPAWGPIGALMNWWRIKVSGGCP